MDVLIQDQDARKGKSSLFLNSDLEIYSQKGLTYQLTTLTAITANYNTTYNFKQMLRNGKMYFVVF